MEGFPYGLEPEIETELVLVLEQERRRLEQV